MLGHIVYISKTNSAQVSNLIFMSAIKIGSLSLIFIQDHSKFKASQMMKIF